MMRSKLWRVLAVLFSAVTAVLSLADGAMFARMVFEGGQRLYLLFALSLVGAAMLLLTVLLRRRRMPRLTVLCMVWLFVNAFVFLLLPSEAYLLTVVTVAPLDWLFKVVPYFFSVALTLVSVTQTLGHKE